MYLLGFIQTKHPLVLINPVACRSVTDLHDQITKLLNDKDFKLSESISIFRLMLEIAENEAPLRVNFEGYDVALLLGDEKIIHAATEKFVYVESIKQYFSN